jgi:hypothetical protein
MRDFALSTAFSVIGAKTLDNISGPIMNKARPVKPKKQVL